MKLVLVFALLKGGVGKTTSAIGVSNTLGMMSPESEPVLFVDADPQATATSSRDNLLAKLNGELTSRIEQRGGEVTDKDLALCRTFQNVYPYHQTQMPTQDRAQVTSQLVEMAIGNYVPTTAPIPEWAGEGEPAKPVAPSVMVIDTSPGFAGMLAGVLDFVATQPLGMIIVPTTMDEFDIAQARQFPSILAESSAANVPYALLPTKVDGRREEHAERIEALRQTGTPVFETVVPYGAPFQRGPISEYKKPKSPFNRVYKAVANEAIKIAANPQAAFAGVGE